MCTDANAGARAAARQRAREKDANFRSEGLKFFNKETQLERAQDNNVIGFSRDNSDAYVRSLRTIGKGRLAVEDATRAYFAKQKVDEGGRSTRFAFNQYQGLLARKSKVDSVIDNLLGQNTATVQQLALRKFQGKQAQAREALGIPPSYGAPVMMPPTNRLGGALQIMQTGLSIGSSLFSPTGGLFPNFFG